MGKKLDNSKGVLYYRYKSRKLKGELMKKLILNVCAAVLTLVGLGGVAMVSPAYAAPNTDYVTSTDPDAGNTDLMSTINTVINVVLGIVALIAVIMIIIGGISFITSQGDSAKVTKAKNTVLYGVIGLVVALLAFAIVNFVLGDSGIFGTA